MAVALCLLGSNHLGRGKQKQQLEDTKYHTSKSASNIWSCSWTRLISKKQHEAVPLLSFAQVCQIHPYGFHIPMGRGFKGKPERLSQAWWLRQEDGEWEASQLTLLLDPVLKKTKTKGTEKNNKRELMWICCLWGHIRRAKLTWSWLIPLIKQVDKPLQMALSPKAIGTYHWNFRLCYV